MTTAGKALGSDELRVAVLGYGAIGASVADALASDAIEGAVLTGVITREPSRAAHPHRRLTLSQALESSDIVVECAGTQAAAEFGERIVASGTDLFLASIGVLADAALRERLLHGGPGRTYLTTGAIGGIDLLAAASLGGGLDTVRLTTTKKAPTLVQPWMSSQEAEELTFTDQPITIFDGGVLEAIRLFPKSLNVAVALAAATGLWEATTVTMVADPRADLTLHEIAAWGKAGDYRFTISNLPHEANPTTSKVVPAAILRGLARLARPSGTFL